MNTIAQATEGAQIKLHREQKPPTKAWVNLFEANKMASKGMELKFIPPMIIEGEKVVELAQEDVASENEK